MSAGIVRRRRRHGESHRRTGAGGIGADGRRRSTGHVFGVQPIAEPGPAADERRRPADTFNGGTSRKRHGPIDIHSMQIRDQSQMSLV